MRATERAVTRLLNDAEELKFMREECANLEWQNTELGTQNQVMRRAIQSLVDTYYDSTVTDEMIESLRGLLNQEVEICACGHLVSEHDQNGCCWLQCKQICGSNE